MMTTKTSIRLLAAIFAFSATVVVRASTASGGCSNIIFFGMAGFSNLDTESWRKSGFDGLFVKGVVTNWQDSPGNDEHSEVYRSAKQFQDTYSRAGISQNFIEVYIHGNNNHSKQVDLADENSMARVVSNLKDTAHLARYAGLKGIALDLEEHENLWKEDPGVPDKQNRLFAFGQRVGAAIKQEYPDATLFVLPEVLVFGRRGATQKNYAMSQFFWNGLIRAQFNRLVIGCERSYRFPKPEVILEQTKRVYWPSLAENGVNQSTASIALGLWPIGAKAKKGKALFNAGPTFALEAAGAFNQRLQMAVGLNQPYVWIFAQGDPWHDPQANDFKQAMQSVKQRCL